MPSLYDRSVDPGTITPGEPPYGLHEAIIRHVAHPIEVSHATALATMMSSLGAILSLSSHIPQPAVWRIMVVDRERQLGVR